MKILHLLPYTPFPLNLGDAVREYHTLTTLAANHDVTVLMYGNEEDHFRLRKELGPQLNDIHTLKNPSQREQRRFTQLTSLISDKSYTYWYYYERNMQKKLDEIFEHNDIDAVHTGGTEMGIFNLPEDCIKILDTYQIDSENYRRIASNSDSLYAHNFYRKEYKKNFEQERHVLQNQDVIITSSDHKRYLISRMVGKTPIYVIPNGADTSHFSPEDEEPKANTMVFYGMMAYIPNDDGMIYFLDQIYPQIRRHLPDAKIYIVGNNPTRKLQSYSGDGVEIINDIQDPRPYIRQASVFIAPLRCGSGNQQKMLEAMAMQKPIVSTPIGCEELQVQDGEHMLIRSDPDKFAQAVIRLLLKPDKARELAANGAKLVRENYNWQHMHRRLQSVYKQIANRTEYIQKSSTVISRKKARTDSTSHIDTD